jgi:hypothetical protein
MNQIALINWSAWKAEEPTPEFVDQVMRAVIQLPSDSAVRARRRKPGRTIAVFSAGAIAIVSFAVFAQVGFRVRHTEPSHKWGAAESGGHVVNIGNHVAEDSGVRGLSTPVIRKSGTVVNRKLREEVRAKLVPTLQAQGIERDPMTGFTLPGGSTAQSHNLSQDYILARLREDFYPLARACYASALTRLPGLHGTFVIDFMIVGDAKVGGIVDQAKTDKSSDITDPEFSTCVRESMLSMVFEPPENDGWLIVRLPVRFEPSAQEKKPSGPSGP